MFTIATKSLLIATTLAAALTFAGRPSLAGEGQTTHTMKPLQALSFNAGSRHGVGYFTGKGGACKVVLTLADEPKSSESQSFAVSRYETTVLPGREEHYQTDGRSMVFACREGGQSMDFSIADQFAGAPAE